MVQVGAELFHAIYRKRTATEAVARLRSVCGKTQRGT